MVLAIAVFAIALGVIASERVHRTAVALLGAALVVVSHTIDQEEAIAAVDFNTIGLLAGMMLIVRLTEPSGVYNYLAISASAIRKVATAIPIVSSPGCFWARVARRSLR